MVDSGKASDTSMKPEQEHYQWNESHSQETKNKLIATDELLRDTEYQLDERCNGMVGTFSWLFEKSTSCKIENRISTNDLLSSLHMVWKLRTS